MTNHTWADLWRRTWCAIPTAIINRMDGKTKPVERNFISVLVTLALMTLTGASIINLAARANYYHQSINAQMVGVGFAALIPIAVVAAVHYRVGRYQVAFIWTIAVIFAIMSAAVQVNIYSTKSGLTAESFAFGAGIPLAEILLAALDGMMISYFAEKKLVASEQAKTDQADAERKEQERQEREYRLELQRKADNQRLENERLDAEAKRAKRYAVAVNEPVNEPVNRSVNTVNTVNATGNTSEGEKLAAPRNTVDDNALLSFYTDNQNASLRAAGAQFGVSHTQISKILKRLESEGRVHVNGTVEVQHGN